MMRHRCMIPFRCVVFISGVGEVFRTSILPAMAAHLYLFPLPIRRLIQLRWGVLQEPHVYIKPDDSHLSPRSKRVTVEIVAGQAVNQTISFQNKK